METSITKIINGIMNHNAVQGVVVADKNGLLLGAAGEASTANTGILTALSDLANKLEPALKPTIVLENASNQCIIQGNENLILGVYQTTT